MIRDSVTAAGTGARAIAYRTHIPTKFFSCGHYWVSHSVWSLAAIRQSKQLPVRYHAFLTANLPTPEMTSSFPRRLYVPGPGWVLAALSTLAEKQRRRRRRRWRPEVPRRRYWPDETRGISENSQSISSTRLSTAMSGPPAPDKNPPSAGLCRWQIVSCSVAAILIGQLGLRCDSLLIFIAHQHVLAGRARYWYGMSVCLSVCPSVFCV